MKILVINQPLNNRGDESAHKGLLRAMCKRIPNIEIKVLFDRANPDSIKQFDVRIPNVEYVNLHNHISWFHQVRPLKFGTTWLWLIYPDIKEILSFYKWADYVVCAPGGICMGGFQDWIHLFYLYMAKIAKRPLAYYGRSFGPFPTETWSNRRFKKLSLNILHYFSYCSVRDKKTQELANKLGIPYEPTIDSAFLDSPKTNLPYEIDSIVSSPYVVFVPNLLIWHYAYNNVNKEQVLIFFSKIYEEIVKAYPQYNVLMLPQTFNFGNYLNDDRLFFLDLKKRIGSPNLYVLSDKYSSDLQQTIINGAVFLVGARYHSIVFAINQSIPFVALSYEHKIQGLIETINKCDSLVDITHAFESEVKEQNCIKKFQEVINNLNFDSSIRKRAKDIASSSFEKFINNLKVG